MAHYFPLTWLTPAVISTKEYNVKQLKFEQNCNQNERQKVSRMHGDHEDLSRLFQDKVTSLLLEKITNSLNLLLL
jgi:hypothetical protein